MWISQLDNGQRSHANADRRYVEGTGSQERGLRVKIALQRFVNSVHGHWIGPEIM
jgi:hypothetical protein